MHEPAQRGGLWRRGFDSQHNLWVADTDNNRVLRFPAGGGGVPQTSADLVLGQSNFNSTSTANMVAPIGVRIDGNGNVYVMDLTSGGRILVYNALSFAGNPAVPGPDMVYTGNLTQPWGIDMDGAGNLWVANQSGGLGSGNVIALQPAYNGSGSVTGLTPVNALMQDAVPPTSPSGSSGETGPNFFYASGNPIASAFIQGPQYVVVDGNGTVFVSAKGPVQNVFRFPGPIPTPLTGHSYSADAEVFKQSEPGMWNQVGWNGLNQVFGVATAQDNPNPQLIVADSYRLDFWNIAGGPQGLSNGQVPDGYAGVNSSGVTLPGTNGASFTRIRVDHSSGSTGSQHLWVVANEQTAQVYNLPLANYAGAGTSLTTNIPVLGSPSSFVDWTGVGGLSGLNDVAPCGNLSAPYAGGPVSYLWVADNFHSRVFRVRDPLGKLGLGPVVDILIGQTTAANNTCGNFGTWAWPNCNGSVTPNQYTLNWPGSMTLDHAGNLYVCDFSLETAGNWRFLEYDESQIAQATQNSLTTGQVQFLSNSGSYTGAAHIYGDNGHLTDGGCNYASPPSLAEYLCMPLEAAFPTGDQAMVVAGFERVPVVIPDPRHNFDPGTAGEPAWNHLNDFYSNMYSETFDNQNNLYAVDNNRARVLVYYNPLSLNISTATYTPTPTPTFTNSPTNTPTNTSFVTSTNSPTNSPTVTPTDTASNTATNTPTNTQTNTSTDTPIDTPSNTASNTPSLTPSNTPTSTPANTATITPINTSSNSPTDTPTDTASNTQTPTFSGSPTDTPTPTQTNTATSTPTNAASNTPTFTPSDTPTSTPANTATVTPTNTSSDSPTDTPTDTASNTPSLTPPSSPTDTPTPTQTNTATSTPTNSASNTPTLTPPDSPTNSSTSTATNTPTNTASNTATLSFTITATLTSTHTLTNTATNSATSSPTKTPTPTPTNTLTNTATKTPTLTATKTTTNTATLMPTATPTLAPTAACGTSPAQLQLKELTNSCGTNQVQDTFEVVNNGAAVTLSDITLKFWADDTSGLNLVGAVYTGGCLENPSCFHSLSGVSISTLKFTPACGPDGSHQANWEITVSNADNTVLNNGVSWVGLQTALHRSDYANFSPGTGFWYSPCVGGTYTANSHYAIYLKGNLVTASGGVPPACRPVPTCTSGKGSVMILGVGAGIEILTPTPTITPTLLPAVLTGETMLFPNPADGTTQVKLRGLKLPGISDVRVQFFTTGYRKVQDLTIQQVKPGDDLALSLSDHWGTALANGLYYVVVTVENSRWTGKLLVLR